jgi:hypothetical protein
MDKLQRDKAAMAKIVGYKGEIKKEVKGRGRGREKGFNFQNVHRGH